jgi:hypothetical protein
MTNKIRLYDAFGEFYTYKSISSIIEDLKKAQQAMDSGEWSDLRLHFANGMNGWIVKGYRWETDGEYEKRIKELQKVAEFKDKMKTEKEEEEKKLYEQLKKKYGDK